EIKQRTMVKMEEERTATACTVQPTAEDRRAPEGGRSACTRADATGSALGRSPEVHEDERYRHAPVAGDRRAAGGGRVVAGGRAVVADAPRFCLAVALALRRASSSVPCVSMKRKVNNTPKSGGNAQVSGYL
ncbi:hypothetical protein Dimus_036927, partial [Dionaea muscipula]